MQAVTHSLWFIVTKICANITHTMNKYQDCNCDYTLLLVSLIILQMFYLEIKILICKWKCTSSYSLILTHSHQDMFKTSLILWTNTKIATVCKWTSNTLHHKMHVHFFKHFKLNLFLRYFILLLYRLYTNVYCAHAVQNVQYENGK
jgi:hypothetical protein